MKEKGKGNLPIKSANKNYISKVSIREKQFINAIIDGKSQTQAYMDIYKQENRGKARVQGSKLWRRMQTKKSKELKVSDGLDIDTKVNASSLTALQQVLDKKGLTDDEIAEKLKAMLNQRDKNGKLNLWGIRFGLDMIAKIRGDYAPVKQIVEHITPATSKDVAMELFRMLEDAGYMRFIKKVIQVYESGGKPEEVAEYTIEDEKQV